MSLERLQNEMNYISAEISSRKSQIEELQRELSDLESNAMYIRIAMSEYI